MGFERSAPKKPAGNFTLTATNCSATNTWTAVSGATWLSITSNISGNGSLRCCRIYRAHAGLDLNPVGTRAWQLLQEDGSLSRVLDAMLAEYDVSRDQCSQD